MRLIRGHHQLQYVRRTPRRYHRLEVPTFVASGVSRFYDGIRDRIRGLVFDLGKNGISTFTFNQRYNGLLIAFANQRICFPVSDLAKTFNVLGTIGNGSTSNDLPSSISSARITLATLPLAP